MADYAGMSLRKELETRFAEKERREQEEEFLSRGWQPPAEQTIKILGDNNLLNTGNDIQIPYNWNRSEEGKRLLDYVIEKEQGLSKRNIVENSRNSLYFNYAPWAGLVTDYFRYKKLPYNDKYKHAVMNCRAAQYGNGGMLSAQVLSGLKEFYDVKSGNNTTYESEADNYANKIGRFLGYKYPEGNCDEMVGRYIKKRSE